MIIKSETLSPEHKALQQRVRRFVNDELAPRMSEIYHSETIVPSDLTKRCGELEFWSVLVPKALGGTELGVTGFTIVLEELAKECPSLALIGQSWVCTAESILACPAATKKYLPGLLNGDLVGCGAVTEPQGHTNISEWSPFGRIDPLNPDYYILNGTKLYHTGNYGCDVTIAYGLNEERQMKIWVVEGGADGVDHRGTDNKFGMKGSGGGTMSFKDVRIHKDFMYPAAVGDGKTYYILYTVCPAIGVGAAEGIFEKTVEYVKKRTFNGAPLVQHSFIRGKLAKLSTQINACRTMIYQSCRFMDDPSADEHQAVVFSQMCKAYIPDIVMEVCEECIQILGEYGYDDAAFYHYAADVLSCGIMDLPTDYQYQGIADKIGIE